MPQGHSIAMLHGEKDSPQAPVTAAQLHAGSESAARQTVLPLPIVPPLANSSTLSRTCSCLTAISSDGACA